MFDPTELKSGADKDDVADHVHSRLIAKGYMIEEENDKPWGVEFKIGWKHADLFLADLYAGAEVPAEIKERPVGPKILIIERAGRLSWHYHRRKDALLSVLHGSVAASLSLDDEEPPPRIMLPGETIRVGPLVRHRLSSAAGWSIVAEISADVVPGYPSDDDDQHRLRDDYGRGGNG